MADGHRVARGDDYAILLRDEPADFNAYAVRSGRELVFCDDYPEGYEQAKKVFQHDLKDSPPQRG